MDIYLDENLSEYVADALNFLNKGYYPNVQVYSTKTKFGKGATDEEIIQSLGEAGSILITRDINIHKTRLQYALCQNYNLGIFFLKLPKNQNKHWEIVKLLINNWEEIIDKSNKERKPFGYNVSQRGKMEKL
jgi:predicted nuclease of predicted toxin-antitoxin system